MRSVKVSVVPRLDLALQFRIPHSALRIWGGRAGEGCGGVRRRWREIPCLRRGVEGDGRRRVDARPPCRDVDRKSTRLNSSHQIISYAVFCLKKKKKEK